jgi:predicted glycoside hydrolase/deacetylase ChbG (UPF0249 family)
MTKTLLLCADDYGLSAPVSRGILRLAAQQRLSHTSCIVNTPDWQGFAGELARGGLQAGLHLNLTEGRPLSPALAARWPTLPSLPALIVQAHARQLPLAAVREEWRVQLDAFEQATGQAPTHFDGHQHVAHLPQLRELLLELLALRPGVRARHTGQVDGPGFGFKRWVIAHTGGRTLGRELERQGRAQNRQLLGVYDFKGPYRPHMQGWLNAVSSQGALLFCHPGEAGADDVIAGARAIELDYLASPSFADDLAAAGVTLSAADRPSAGR